MPTILHGVNTRLVILSENQLQAMSYDSLEFYSQGGVEYINREECKEKKRSYISTSSIMSL